MSEGTEHTEKRTESIGSSRVCAEYRDILIEPINLGEIKSISDKKAFFSLLLPQKRIVVSVKKPFEQRREAAALARGLYHLRINYLSIKADFDEIQKTVEHYNGWSHHMEQVLQTPGFTRDFELLRMSIDEISEMQKIAAMIRARELVGTEPELADRDMEYGPVVIQFVRYVQSGHASLRAPRAALNGLLFGLRGYFTRGTFALGKGKDK